MENSTSLMLFGIAFLAIFGVLIGITGAGTASITMNEIISVIITDFAVAIGVAIALSVVAGITAFGIGSAESGHFIWKGAMFAAIAVIMGWIATKMLNLMPADMPSFVAVLFIAPPMGALFWGMIDTFFRSGG